MKGIGREIKTKQDRRKEGNNTKTNSSEVENEQLRGRVRCNNTKRCILAICWGQLHWKLIPNGVVGRRKAVVHTAILELLSAGESAVVKLEEGSVGDALAVGANGENRRVEATGVSRDLGDGLAVADCTATDRGSTAVVGSDVLQDVGTAHIARGATLEAVATIITQVGRAGDGGSRANLLNITRIGSRTADRTRGRDGISRTGN